MIKKIILAFALLSVLSGCKSGKEVICDSVINRKADVDIDVRIVVGESARRVLYIDDFEHKGIMCSFQRGEVVLTPIYGVRYNELRAMYHWERIEELAEIVPMEEIPLEVQIDYLIASIFED